MIYEDGHIVHTVGYMILHYYAGKENILVSFVDAERKIRYSMLNGVTMVGDERQPVDLDFDREARQVMCYESITIEPIQEKVSFAACVNIARDVKRMAGECVAVELQPCGAVMLTAI